MSQPPPSTRPDDAAATPHVALLVETSRSYGRDILRGVNRWMQERGPWSVFLELRGLDSSVPRWLRGWQGDGILSRTGSAAMDKAIAATGLPAVELRASRLPHQRPFVGVDNNQLGQLVAEHLTDNGFTNFAVFDVDTETYFEERRDGFIRFVEGLGRSCHTYHAGRGGEHPTDWERHQAAVADWVQTLPKPVGILACTDQLGFWLLDACRRAGVAVPEEVAVVGVENDETLCQMATPRLSSVAFDGDRVGYEAAALLDRLMRGGPPPEQPLVVPPRGIVTRQSSDIVAIADTQVAAALRIIREHTCHGLAVSEVVNQIGISRTALERRMKAAIGRTPGEEIVRVRFARVKALLVETDLTLAAIADRCGMEHPQYMAEAFKKQFGMTPGAFRSQNRMQS
jgi:LacI family transcriptional regulator